MAPNIENPKNLELPSGAEEILQEMFPDYGRVVIDRQFAGGMSGSWVFLIFPIQTTGETDHSDLPVVIKVAATSLIQKEAQAFKAHIENQLHDIADIRGGPTTPIRSELAGLYYPLQGGGTFEVISLREYCRQASVEDIRFTLERRLMRVIKRLAQHSPPWSKFHLRHSYDRVLPVNLWIDPQPLPADITLVLVKPDKPPSDPLKPGDYVRLEGFAISKIDLVRDTVTLNHPSLESGFPPSYVVRLDSRTGIDAEQVNRIIAPIEGKVTKTRDSQLQSEAQAVLGSAIDLGEQYLLLEDGSRLPNPLPILSKLLQTTPDVRVGVVHGDLNLENILIDPEVRDVNLIDFAEARRDHILHDYLRLETEIMTKLVPELLHPHGLDPALLISRFYQQLHWASLDPNHASVQPPHPALEKPLAMLLIIRQTARQFLFDINDYSEYYLGLTLYLLGTLKFRNLSEADEAPLPKQVAFWGATTALGLYTGELEQDIPPCPYRGLEFFDVEHADDFFGREELTGHLVEKLSTSLKANPSDTPRFLAIVGPSGSGKSSLARAGLVAALKRDDIEGSANWPIAICRPGTNPLQSLAEAIAGTVGLEEDTAGWASLLAADLRDNKRTLHRTIEQTLQDTPPERHFVVLVDQFEETFTLCRDEELRQALLDNLLYAIGATGGRTVILLTLRADFYGKCATYPELAELLSSDQQQLVGPMTSDQLQAAIERPAQQAGCTFEPGLVELLLDDVKNEAGGLPLLQHALLELWGQQKQRRLTHAAYEAIGRVTGALQQRADIVFESFDETKQQICRHIFLRLTRLGEGTEDTRRQVSKNELLDRNEQAKAIEGVIRKLTDARLVTTTRDADSREERIDVAHEALIRNWTRLRSWVEADRVALGIHHRLAEEARKWDQANKSRSYLYQGIRLSEAEGWAKNYGAEMNALERDFLKRSVLARKRTQVLLWISGLVAVLVIVGIFATIAITQNQVAIIQRQAATDAQSRALSSAALTNLTTDPELSILLALHAINISDTNEAEQALYQAVQTSRVRDTLSKHTDTVWTVVFSPDGTHLATASFDGTVRIWDAQTGEEKHIIDGQAGKKVWGVVFNPTGTRLAASGDDNTLKVWDANSDQELLTFSGHTKRVRSIAFNPDGTLLISGSADKEIKIWDAATGELLRTLSGHVAAVTDVAFSPNGKLAASASEDNTLKLWDTTTGDELFTLSGHTDDVNSVVFSPDGRYLASASRDETVKIWEVVAEGEMITAEEILNLADQTTQVWDVAFSPDGGRLALTEAEGAVKVVNAKTGQLLFTLSGHTDAVRSVAFSPDGSLLATAGWDNSVKIWNASSHNDIINDVTFSPDTKLAATASQDGTIKLWDVETGHEERTLLGHTKLVRRVVFNSDGTLLATASEDNTAKVWDVQSGEVIHTLIGHTFWVYGVAFSPDSRYLATASYDNTAKIWDLNTGIEIRTLSGHDNWVNDVVFDPTGTYLATASFDNTAKIWRVETGELVNTLPHSDIVTSVDFDPDGSRLVTAGAGGMVKISDVASGEEVMSLLGHDKWVRDVTFNTNGKFVAAASQDNTAKVWDATSGELVRILHHMDDVNSVAFRPNLDQGAGLADELLATASAESAFIHYHPLGLEKLKQNAKAQLERTGRTLTPIECQQYFQQNQCPSLP